MSSTSNPKTRKPSKRAADGGTLETNAQPKPEEQAAANDPAAALRAIAAQSAAQAGGQIAAHAAQQQVMAAPPVKMEVRIGGRVRFSNTVYSPHFDTTNGMLTVTAALEPTMIDPPVQAPTRFYQQDDPRDGEDVILRVHSGRRDIAPPEQQQKQEES